MEILENSSSCLLILAKISDWKEKLAFVNGLGYSQECHYNNSSFLWKHFNFYWINLEAIHETRKSKDTAWLVSTNSISIPTMGVNNWYSEKTSDAIRFRRQASYPTDPTFASLVEISVRGNPGDHLVGGDLWRRNPQEHWPCSNAMRRQCSSQVISLHVDPTNLRQQLWNRTDACSFSVK